MITFTHVIIFTIICACFLGGLLLGPHLAALLASLKAAIKAKLLKILS